MDSRFRGNDKHWCHKDFLRDHHCSWTSKKSSKLVIAYIEKSILS